MKKLVIRRETLRRLSLPQVEAEQLKKEQLEKVVGGTQGPATQEACADPDTVWSV